MRPSIFAATAAAVIQRGKEIGVSLPKGLHVSLKAILKVAMASGFRQVNKQIAEWRD